MTLPTRAKHIIARRYACTPCSADFALIAHKRLPFDAQVMPDTLPSPASSADTPRRRERSLSLESSASSPTPAKRARTTPGFIILRPSADGAGLRVAAASPHSFHDALDALRHRAAPDDDGEQAPRPRGYSSSRAAPPH